MDKLRVTLIGAYPPPYGGVSVHIQRLQDFLLNNGFQCIVIDFSSSLKNAKNVINAGKIKNLRYIQNAGGGIIHIHSSGINLKKIMAFFLLSVLCKIRRNKLIITFHSFRDHVKRFDWLEKIMLKAFSKFALHYIAVSSLIKNKLLSLNIDPNKISVITGFLPPTTKQHDIDEIPQEIWNFIDNHWPVISANGFRISFYNNQDLYGIDMCIDLCNKLQDTYTQIGFIFCLSDIGDHNYFKKIRQTIAEKGIADNFLFVTRSCQFYPILMKSDVFVRPTNTDGDAVSVREALYFKIPTVASDVVPRPEGVILFKNRDINDFTLKVEDVLDNYTWHKKRLEAVKVEEDNFQEIISLYEQLYGHAERLSEKRINLQRVFGAKGQHGDTAEKLCDIYEIAQRRK